MRRARLFPLLLTAGLLVGCGPPVLDTSDGEALVASMDELKGSLEPAEVAQLEDAFYFLTDDAPLSGNPERLDASAEAAQALHGLTAQDIILRAWQTRIERLGARVAELEARREASTEARRILAGLEVVEARLFPPAAGFVDKPVVELEVVNRTGRNVFALTLKASLRHPDELEPWVVETVDRPFGAGLAPGAEVTFRVELEDSDWRRMLTTDERAIFACDVVTLLGRRNRVIAESDYGDIDEYLHAALAKRLGLLQDGGPGTIPGKGP